MFQARLLELGAIAALENDQRSLSAGALRYRAWVQSWSSAALALQESISQSCVSYGSSVVGLMVTSSKSP